MKIAFTKDKKDFKEGENRSDVYPLELDLAKGTTWRDVVPLLKTYNFFDKGDYVWVLYDNIEQEILCYYASCEKVFFFHALEEGLVCNVNGEADQIVTPAVISGKPLRFVRQSRKQRGHSLFMWYGGSDYMMWHEGVDGQFALCDITREEKDRWAKEASKLRNRKRG